MCDVEQWEYDEQRAMEQEIERLRAELEKANRGRELYKDVYDELYDELAALKQQEPVGYFWRNLDDDWDQVPSHLAEQLEAVPLYLAPQPAQVPQWQPIETAPKDGTSVLVIAPQANFPLMAYYVSGRWFSSNGGGWVGNPTCWMPLSAAPQPAQESKDKHHINALIDEIRRKDAAIRELDEKKFSRFNNEECWIFQGDGSDNLEGLVCPVVIDPKMLLKLLAPQPAQAPQWQPIETAPKDETFLAVLECGGEQTICTMRWPVAERKNSLPHGRDFIRERVTHWMPLPAAPQQEEK